MVETIAEALDLDGATGGALVDLYCGVGAIGLALSDRVDRLVGIEIHEGAVVCARANAAAMGVDAEFHAGPVEHVLPGLGLGMDAKVVVDPPRAGLHPKAAAFLAQHAASELVYVACGPASLGRDRALLGPVAGAFATSGRSICFHRPIMSKPWLDSSGDPRVEVPGLRAPGKGAR